MLMNYLCLFLGFFSMHVCPKYWPMADTTSFELGQAIWGFPNGAVCLPPNLRHLVMVCHLSWSLLRGLDLHFNFTRASSGLSTQQTVHKKHETA